MSLGDRMPGHVRDPHASWQIGRGRGGAAATRRRARLASWRVAAGGGIDQRGYVLEGHGEHVVEHECHLLPDPVPNRIPRVTLTTIFS
jgi:hypothetical protein